MDESTPAVGDAVPGGGGPRARLVALDGDGMTADQAAWAMVADAAELALRLPDLSRASRRDLSEVWTGARIAASLPCEPHPRRAADRLSA